MPLTNFQAELAKLLSTNRTEDSHLAGGAALHFQPNSIRYSLDLDYFHDSDIRVATAFAQDRELLEKTGYSCEIEMNQPGYIRCQVSKEKQATKVEWAHDSAWRFMPTQFQEDIGYMLHPIDLAINKVLALAGRDEARDYLDVLDVHKKTLSLGALCWAACGKDPGFSPLSLLELLKRRGKYRESDFIKLNLNCEIDIQAMKKTWLEMLDQAEIFIKEADPKHLGCLFYSKSKKTFIDAVQLPGNKDDIELHFGAPGGVLPKFF